MGAAAVGIRRVLATTGLGKGGFVLRVEGPLGFKAGQAVGLSLDGVGAPRLYSLCSSALRRDWFEVLFTVVDGGELTPRLAALGPGDQLWVEGPVSGFADVEPGEGGRTVWICTGTGVAPFLSMIRTELDAAADQGRQPDLGSRVLVYGCRSLREAWLLADISEACARTGLSALLCVSAQEGGLPHDRGGISYHRGRIASWPGLGAFCGADRVLLCGSTEMVTSTRERLYGSGLGLRQVFSEIYF